MAMLLLRVILLLLAQIAMVSQAPDGCDRDWLSECRSVCQRPDSDNGSNL